MNYFVKNKAQGTIEYLIIIAVVVVISLALVTILLTQGETAQKIGADSDKTQGIIGKGGISITDSMTSSSGDSVISLKNNSGETLTITKLTPIDDQGNLGATLDYNSDLLPGYELPFILTGINSICPCTIGKTTTCKIKITFFGASGLEKNETLTITNVCTSTINYFNLNYSATLGGQIIGNSNQKVLAGENGSSVTAQAENGYVFIQWSDGSTNLTRTDTNVIENKTITAQFGLPPIAFVESCWDEEATIHPICNCFDLNQVRNHFTWDYELQNDINMNVSECEVFQTGEGFKPIDDPEPEPLHTYYSETFDGNGHNIIGLYINRPNEDNVGLFSKMGIISRGDLHPAQIKNLGLIDANIIGQNHVGGVTGVNQMGSNIDNVYVSGEIIGTGDNVGGLIGTNTADYQDFYEQGFVSNSYVDATITGANNVGGLVGSSSENLLIFDSYSIVELEGETNIGGILGSGDATMNNLFSTSIISGTSNAGGVIGLAENIEIDNLGWYNIDESSISAIGNPVSDVNYSLTDSDYTQLFDKSFILYNTGINTWDFKGIWAEQENNYPKLFWQTNSTPTEIFIENCEDLQLMNNNLDLDYTLRYSIDCSDTSSWNDENGFIPIGNMDIPFSGNFNARGYKISNLYINRPGTNYVGLFGNTSSTSIIENLMINNSTIIGGQRTAGLVGQNDGNIKNVYIQSGITGNGMSGGLVGYNSGNIFNSSVTGVISSEGGDRIGGLAGYSNGTINNSYFTGTVIGAGYDTGGLVGSNTGTIIYSYAQLGGLSGHSYTGGIAGVNNGTITDSYAYGPVSGDTEVGGLVGKLVEGTITRTYSTGSVTGNSNTGGLIGDYSRGTVSDSYWDVNTSGQETSVEGTPSTTEQMKIQSTFVDWDFDNVWSINETETYPYLKYNIQAGLPN